MRTVILIGQLRGGGSERQAVVLADGLLRLGHTAHIVVWTPEAGAPHFGSAAQRGIPVERICGRTSAQKLTDLRRKLAVLSPDVVHSFSFYLNSAAAWACAGTGATPIGSVQSELAYASVGLSRARFMVEALTPRFQIYNNETALEQLQQRFATWMQPRVMVVRNGIEVGELGRTSPLEQVDVPLVLGVGSLFRIKRWDRLIRAAARLKTRGLAFRVVVLGEGESRPELETMVRSLGLTGLVEFPGYATDVASWYDACRVVAHVSETEGHPNAVGEAMAAGRPVVACASGDISRMVVDGRTGFVVDGDDDEMLANALQRVLQDLSLARQMGRAGRDRCFAEFSVDRMVSRMLEAYELALRR